VTDSKRRDAGEESVSLAEIRLPELTPFVADLAKEGESRPLTELLQARNELSRIINRRFKTQRALSFADIVGSTSYFQRFGDEAGQALMQRLMSLVRQSLPVGQGKLVETTGDGCFTAFPTVADAVKSLIALRKAMDQENQDIPGDHRLAVRLGVHWGSVLVDEALVTGDAVNVAARVTTLAGDGQIVITKSSYQELPVGVRPRVKALPPAELKGITGQVEALLLDWRDPYHFPRRMRILETSEDVELPDRDPLSFGRSTAADGETENDVVLNHPDPQLRLRVSRRHFSLHRHPTSWRLRAVSDRAVEVNGVLVAGGTDAPVKAGTVVKVAGVLTLMFMADIDALKLENDPNKTVM
jgi:class 3 adenylate cyclase